MSADLDGEFGGDPPCWAHLLDEPDRDLRDRGDIDVLVRDFYRQVAMDDVLGPVFRAARVDWSVHIPKLVDFWAWQLLGQRGYDGIPLRAHERADARTPFADEHYERWLELFDTTVDERFRGPTAELAKRRARRMARALRWLLSGESAAGSLPVNAMWLATTPVTDRRAR